MRLAERFLVKPLNHQDVQLIRESLQTDYVFRKIQALKECGILKFNFYIFLSQSIGDIIASEPIARYLKSIAPTGKINWIVNQSFRTILESNHYIDDIITINNFTEGEHLCSTLSKSPKNIIVDCHFNGSACDIGGKPHKNPINPKVNMYTHYYLGPLLSTFSLAAGLPPLYSQPIFHLRNNISHPDFGASSYIVFHCKSNEAVRDWCDYKWNRLAKSLALEGYTIVELGIRRIITENYGEKVIDYTGKKSFQELAAIVKDAKLFIGIDSAFSHMANCFKVPSIILLGKYKNFESYLPYSGTFPSSEDFTIIRARLGHPASAIDFSSVLSTAKQKLTKS